MQHLQDYILIMNKVNRDRLLLAHSPMPHISRVRSSQISAGGPDHWQDHTGKDQIIFCPKLTGPLRDSNHRDHWNTKTVLPIIYVWTQIKPKFLGIIKSWPASLSLGGMKSAKSTYSNKETHILYHPLPIFLQLMLDWSSSRSLQHVPAQVSAWMWKGRKQKMVIKSTESL
jgi:hypothetical protein